MTSSIQQSTRTVLDQLRRELLEQRSDEGHWVGELSASSLSTATALSAMSVLLIHATDSSSDDRLGDCIARGTHYLRQAQNQDGGYGDTDRSHSNIATSYLVLAASTLAARATGDALADDQLDRLNRYIDQAGAIEALRRRYGKDKTFVVPILTNLAIAELFPWDLVPALPFEAAVFPQSMYRLLRMPVVSYAIPALVAIGQARHFHGSRAMWPLRAIRAASVGRTMDVLQRMQPQSGGYLEATPLTSFVVMSLAASGRGGHAVSRNGLRFLFESMNRDGSWPIDTNLATWVTSLAMHALGSDPEDDGAWCSESLVRWHLGCQHQQRHPFTGAEPGGWGWSDLSGAVPDSDDTPGAIIAIRHAQRWTADPSLRQQCDQAIDFGIDWLNRLQNRDGGWPTFCRGWGKLPFDRSSNDLTAHALRAIFVARQDDFRGSRRCAKATRFLESNQQQDGSWLPLWFGNQDQPDESNPIYGTSRVLATAGWGVISPEAVRRGCDFLIANQNSDGGWGGGPSVEAWLNRTLDSGAGPGGGRRTISSVEETALAVDGLATVLLAEQSGSVRNSGGPDGVELSYREAENSREPAMLPFGGTAGGNEPYREAIIRGVEFLLGCVDEGRHRVPWPIGFYFAKLWYHERLYPLIFTTTALAKYWRLVSDRADPN